MSYGEGKFTTGDFEIIIGAVMLIALMVLLYFYGISQWIDKASMAGAGAIINCGNPCRLV
jgi:hypothetical protein